MSSNPKLSNMILGHYYFKKDKIPFRYVYTINFPPKLKNWQNKKNWLNNPLGHCDNHKRQCSHFEVVMGKRWLFPYVWQQGSLQQSIIVIEDSLNISRLRKLRFLKYIEDTNCLRVDNVAIVRIILLNWHMFCIHSTNPNQVKCLNFKPFHTVVIY